MALENVMRVDGGHIIGAEASSGGYIKKTGSTISELTTAIDDLTNSQKIRAKIQIGVNVLTNYYISGNYYGYNFVQASSNGPVVEYRLTKVSSTPQMQALTTNGTTTTISSVPITSWSILYQDDSPSGGNTYPASQVMMSDGDSVEDRVNANTIDGDYIDITSYIYNSGTYNDYTAPSDGYVVFKYTANSDGGILVKTDENTHITMATTKELVQSIFVKKGMQFCFGSTPSIGRFYSFV